MTTTQTVRGVERNSPTGPHSMVQKIAAIMIASDDRPVLEPYSQGSTTLLLISSATRNRPATQNSIVQPGSTAIGNSAAMKGPRYGMKRSTAASSPHRIAFGTPTK